MTITTEQIKAAAEWWTDRLVPAKHLGGTGTLFANNEIKVTPEQKALFKANLIEQLNRDAKLKPNNTSILLKCGYQCTSPLLKLALTQAVLTEKNLPEYAKLLLHPTGKNEETLPSVVPREDGTNKPRLNDDTNDDIFEFEL